ncbi:hypothetical protein [Gluconobacter morbifer]|uniref:Uncharacterized protein n=1 Tax=Gluconobacter morbifer G707 TaxID=1088869 RepID=G6XKZ4_9PROT|nr:hypothetical protein [Gluconobacter morbifer]EHH67589.1 hypothetical protein GMO_21600 [Gluconobacter morbifer G707]
MNAVAMLREAASQTMGFDMGWLPKAQAVLINLFSRCGDETTVEDCMEGINRVGPDGVMGACERRIALRLLARLPADRLISDVRNELVQDLDQNAVEDCLAVSETLSMELFRDAAAIRGLGFVSISRTQGEEFARNLEAKAEKARQLENENAVLRARLGMQARPYSALIQQKADLRDALAGWRAWV